MINSDPSELFKATKAVHSTSPRAMTWIRIFGGKRQNRKIIARHEVDDVRMRDYGVDSVKWMLIFTAIRKS